MMASRMVKALAAMALLPAAPTHLAAKAPLPAATNAEAPASFLSLDQLRTRYGVATDRYLDIGGISIRYRDEGQGPVIVLLHGSYGALTSYDGVAENLARSYRVIRFDMPGMGLSSTLPRSAETPIRFADDILKALLDHLKVSKATIVGVSSGGSLGFYFTRAHPDMVDALILSNAPADPVISSQIQRSPALAAEFREAERTGFKRREYWRIYLEWLAGDTTRMTPGIIDKYYDLNRRQPAADARNFWRSTNDVPLTRATLAAVTKPVLLVWGEKDLVLPLSSMYALESYLTAAQVSRVIMPDVGHYPPLETPERFAKIVDTYVNDVIPKLH